MVTNGYSIVCSWNIDSQILNYPLVVMATKQVNLIQKFQTLLPETDDMVVPESKSLAYLTATVEWASFLFLQDKSYCKIFQLFPDLDTLYILIMH